MGLSTRSSEKTRFITVFNGKFCERVPENTAGSVTRENKLGNTVHELHFDRIDNAIIQSGQFRDTDYGTELSMEILTDGELIKVSMPADSRYAASAMWKLPFADPSLKFDSIDCYSFDSKDNGKKVSGLSFVQSGKKIVTGYTREDVPSAIERKKLGKVEWDFTDQINWLAERLDEWFGKIGSVDGGAAPAPAPAAEKSIRQEVIDKAVNSGVMDEEDDLPF